MTNEEIIKVIREGFPHEDLLMELWSQNTGIIGKACAKYTGSSKDMKSITGPDKAKPKMFMEQEDALQECFIAFLDAVNDYDLAGRQTFAGYLYNRCRWHLYRYYENCGGMIRIPADQRQKIMKYNRFIREHYQRRGELPSDYTICAMLHLKQDQLDQLRKDLCAVDVKSLDVPLHDDPTGEEAAGLHEIVPDKNVDVEGESIEEAFEEQRRQAVRAAVDTLKPKERQAIRMHYWDGLTYQQAGDVSGVSAQMIRSRIAKGMRQLRTGKQHKILARFITRSDIYSAGLSGGSEAFRRTWTSSTERIALQKVTAEETQRREEVRAEQLRREAVRVYGTSEEVPDAAPSADQA